MTAEELINHLDEGHEAQQEAMRQNLAGLAALLRASIEPPPSLMETLCGKRYRLVCDGKVLATPMTKRKATRTVAVMRKLSPSITWDFTKA